MVGTMKPYTLVIRTDESACTAVSRESCMDGVGFELMLQFSPSSPGLF